MPIAKNPEENQEFTEIELFHPGNKSGYRIPGYGYFYPAQIAFISDLKHLEPSSFDSRYKDEFAFIVQFQNGDFLKIIDESIDFINEHYSGLLNKMDIFHSGDLNTPS